MTTRSLARGALAALFTTTLLSAPLAAQDYTIHAGHIIRDAGEGLGGPATITVADGRITAIADGLLPAPEGATLVDLSDKTVMPGLIDLHVHLAGNPGGDFRDATVDTVEYGTIIAVTNAETTLRAGFTTVRDAGSVGQDLFALRRAAAEGRVTSPRIIAAGSPLSIIGGHGDVSGFAPEINHVLTNPYTCTGPVECAEKVRLAAREGADTIKITATGGVLSQQGRGLGAHFTSAEMQSIADTAQSLGLDVMAHAHGARGIEAAARAGITSIEHGTYADRAAIEAMRENGTVLVPTLLAYRGISEGLGTGVYTPVVEDKIRAVLDLVGNAVGMARDMGVTVAFGTDAGVFAHGRNAEEFGMLIDAGMSSEEAVASATTVAARVLHMEDEIGRLQPGYSADIIALDGNPLEDATLLEQVDWVMVRGRPAD